MKFNFIGVRNHQTEPEMIGHNRALDVLLALNLINELEVTLDNKLLSIIKSLMNQIAVDVILVQLHQLDYSGNNSIHDYIIFQFESNPSNFLCLDIFSVNVSVSLKRSR